VESFLSKNRTHLAIVGCLLCVQFFSRDIVAAHYSLLRRPRLIAAGAKPCEDYKPLIQKEAPRDCDLVVVSSTGAIVDELYFPARGDIETRVRSDRNGWLSTESSYTAHKVSFVFPAVAFLVGVIAVVHKVVRTRAVWSWELSRQPVDRFEQVLAVYWMPVFLGSILFIWLGR
jgi:hypothetical protein